MLNAGIIVDTPRCTVVRVRRHLQASGIGARPQQRPEAHEGAALASEAGDLWERRWASTLCPIVQPSRSLGVKIFGSGQLAVARLQAGL